MITIITHKNLPILEQCIKSLFDFQTEKHTVLICETSEDTSSKKIADKYNCLYANTGPNYEAGAINHAFLNLPFEPEYFFFQDSIEFMAFEWERIFRIPSNNGEKCIGLSTFPINHDHIDTIHAREWYKKISGHDYNWSTNPIFGNMFYCSNKIRNVFVNNKCYEFIPQNKLDSCAMERIWPALLPSDKLSFTSDYTNDFWGWQLYIKKIWHNRG